MDVRRFPSQPPPHCRILTSWKTPHMLLTTMTPTVRNVLLFLKSKDQTDHEPEHDKDSADRDEEAANQDQRGKVHVLRRGR